MKIVADENIPLINEFFGRLGKVVTVSGRHMTAADVCDADALIVRSVTKVNSQLLDGSKVKFVGTCTIGVDHLDQAYLDGHGITWSSAPGCNANSVVEYVYSALSHLNINWLGLRVGIIGRGNVGGLLYKRLKAQGVDVVCYDPHLDYALNPDLVSLEAVLACDVVSMHTPLVKSGVHPSFHLLGVDELRRLKTGAVLLNAGRGAVINNQALLQVLNERPDLRVVLDVWEPEPDISLALLDKVELGTPHIAGYSYDGKLNGTEMIYQACCRAFGIAPQASLQSLVPPLDNNQLLIHTQSDTWANTRTLIKQVYDIAADDARLRELAAQARAGKADFGLGFDNLRKFYPARREFHNYRIDNASETNLKAWLQVLGFHVL